MSKPILMIIRRGAGEEARGRYFPPRNKKPYFVGASLHACHPETSVARRGIPQSKGSLPRKIARLAQVRRSPKREAQVATARSLGALRQPRDDMLRCRAEFGFDR